MKILITGTHFTPAVAVIEELRKTEAEIVYVGRKTTMEGDNTSSIESKILPQLGVRFIPMIAGRLQRVFTLYTVPSLLKIPIGFVQALYIILSEKPDVILSFGGYVAVPLVIAGWLFSIPIIIHEQTMVAGLSNKISAAFADKIAISFKETNEFFNSEKTILTGNPIRKSILNTDTKGVKLTHPKGVQVLIMGGNQGSHAINLVIESCLDKLTKIAEVVHLTGDNKFADFERLQNLGKSGKLGRLGDRYVVKKWLGEEYGSVLQSADLVVCRAGINTLTELAYLGKPALVIPIPYLYQDEQNQNARLFQRLGLVKILAQSKLSGKSLIENVKLMLRNIDELKEKAKNVKQVVIPDAAKRLALETILIKNG